MVSLDWTLGVQLINFIVLIFILNRILYKPIRGILQLRRQKIEGLENGISSVNREAEAKNQALSDGIKRARSQGQKEKELMLQKAAAEERALIDEINSKAQQEMAAAKARIGKEAQTVKTALEREIENFVSAITHKILGRAA